MSVFITGASGFVGQAIVHRLGRDGHDLTALLLPEEAVPDWSVVRCVRGDITRPETLVNAMDGMDAVIHLAGVVGYGVSWAQCRRLNVEGTINVVRAAVASGVRRFIHMSSVSVYGRVSGKRLDEEAPMKKINDPYGDTKIEAEEVIRACEERGELDATVIRPTMIYGPGDRLFLPKLIENIAAGRARIIGRGDHAVDAIHVNDAADFVSLVLNRRDAIGRTYNLNHPNNPDWNQFIAAIAAALGVSAPDRHIPYGPAMVLAALLELASRFTGKPPLVSRYGVRNVGRPYDYSTRRMTREMGFDPKIGLIDGIRECVADHRKEAPIPAGKGAFK
ncbi:MAG: NAD-dependent epimerase/dehydratase family protein [Desulfosalsimonadaceae bacterium]